MSDKKKKYNVCSIRPVMFPVSLGQQGKARKSHVVGTSIKMDGETMAYLAKIKERTGVGISGIIAQVIDQWVDLERRILDVPNSGETLDIIIDHVKDETRHQIIARDREIQADRDDMTRRLQEAAIRNARANGTTVDLSQVKINFGDN